jgi:hypothetical protein
MALLRISADTDGSLSLKEIKKGLDTVREATGLAKSAKQIFKGPSPPGTVKRP